MSPFSLTRLGEWPRLEDSLCFLVVASPISKAATNIALGLTIAIFLRDWARRRRRPRATPLDGAILVWVLAEVLSGVTSVDPLRSFRDLRNIGHWSTYYFLVWGIAAGANLRRLENLWLFAGGVCAAQALLQSSIGFDLQGDEPVIPTGFFNGHLELGHYMVMLLGLAIPRWRESQDRTEGLLLLLAIIAFGGALVVSGGRGPWLAFVVVASSWAILQRSWRALSMLGLVAALQLTFFLRQPEGLESFYRSYLTFEPEPAAVAEDRVASNLWRLTMWREGMRLFALRPLTGTGVETTGELSQDFHTPFREFGVAHLHSNYFEILMTCGFLGLAAFLLFLMGALWVLGGALREPGGGSRAAPRPSTNPAAFAALAAVLTQIVHGFTHFTFGSAPIQVGFYVALGLGVGAVERRRDEAPARELRTGALELAWAAVTIALLIAIEPWLSEQRLFSLLLATGAAVDLAAARLRNRRWMGGGSDLVPLALAGAFAFVVLASALLLWPLPTGDALALRTIVAAAGPFGLAYASTRLAMFWLIRRSGSPISATVESRAAGR